MLKPVFLSASLLLFIMFEVASVPKNPPCPSLKLKFGRVRYRQKGRFVKFMCNTGYIIAGEKYSTCHNGVWDSPMPKCVRASCVKVNPPMNGLIYPSHRGAVLNFFCKPGYDLRGPNATYCDGYTWDNNLPACIVSNSKPALSCNFESEDLCGWNHDLRHDFDWTRMNFKTPSGHLGTGPSFDHTKGDGETGHYMYIESSSRNENDTARLISPIYDKINDSNVCFEFFYHMHGASTGQLRVYLKKESDSWVLDPYTALFWKSGNHGDNWLHSISQIGLIDEDFQIIIEGVRGTSYFSDIAIDDVNIILNCTVNFDVTTESDVTYTDDFKEIGSCFDRCDNDNLIIVPTAYQSNCDCDETCIDKNTCCPDYIALCVLGPYDDPSTSEIPTTTLEDTTTQNINFTETTIVAITFKPKQIITSTTAKRITKKVDTHDINTNEINLVMPKNKQNVTNFPTPGKYNNSGSGTNANKLPQPVNPSLRRPTLVFLTPSTPEVIVQKVMPTAPHRTTFVPQPRPTFAARTTKLRTQFPITKQHIRTSTQALFDEILTVPQRTEDKEAFYLTPVIPLITASPENIANPVPVKKASKNSNPLLFNSGTQNQKIVTEEPKTTSGKFIVIIVACSSFILLGLLSIMFAVKRYRLRGCRNRRNMYGSSSDSQSDVRFLTSDEILDFNIACPDDDER